MRCCCGSHLTQRSELATAECSSPPAPARGGFLSPPVTSVQTSNGDHCSGSAFSGLHGQRLRIRDGIKSGLQLCVEEATAACSDVAGSWTGQLVPVPYRRGITDWIPLYIGDRALPLWFLIGCFATIAVGIATARNGGWGQLRRRAGVQRARQVLARTQ